MNDLSFPFEVTIDLAIEEARDPGPERLVYADWLEEQNTPEASRLAVAQRWMAQQGKWPNYTFGHQHAWTWWRSLNIHDHASLEELPWHFLAGRKNDHALNCDYSTREAAESDLAAVLGSEQYRSLRDSPAPIGWFVLTTRPLVVVPARSDELVVAYAGPFATWAQALIALV